MSKTFVVGDIHGANIALEQCLERSGFNNEEDTLIQLGDVVDGWSESFEAVEKLLTIKNLIAIRGNHDEWWRKYITEGEHVERFKHGALSTLKSYGFNILGKEWNKFQVVYDYKEDSLFTNLNIKDIPKKHVDFFNNQLNYYVDKNNNCFVHGGFNKYYPINKQPDPYIYFWDRSLWYSMIDTTIGEPIKSKVFYGVDNFKNIFIGHTPTINWDTDKPMNSDILYNIDTGAGFTGRLTIMDVETKDYWQSDPCPLIYPHEKGRNK